jgi:CRP-like cAMP-binding protein
MPAQTSQRFGTMFSTIVGDEQLETLTEAFTRRTYAIGTMLVRTGETLKHVYIVQKGRVSLYTETTAGERMMLREVRDGEQFGELALLDQLPSPFTAMAVEESRILELDRADLERLIARYPQIGRELLRSFSIQLRHVLEAVRIQSISNIDVGLERAGSEAMRITRLSSAATHSWAFCVVVASIIVAWMIVGGGISWPVTIDAFDPYPYPMLVAALSIVAVFELQVITHAAIRIRQRRLDVEKRGLESEAKLEVQIASLHAKIEDHHRSIEDHLGPERFARLENEIARLQSDLDEQRQLFDEKLARLTRAMMLATSASLSSPGELSTH